MLLLIGIVGAAVIYAQTPTPPTHPSGPRWGLKGCFGGGPRQLAPAALDAAAKALGMTPPDLAAELNSGKSLSEVATEKGVNLQTVQNAIQAARNAQIAAQINQAVTNGQISQDKANWLLEGLNKGYLDRPGFLGFGFGFGPGGPRMHGGMQPQVAPTAMP